MSGHVLELAAQVEKVFQMISTDTISIFVDRKALQWGEEWRSKISKTILGNTFFIPIISPNYLKSPTCRSEFMEFWTSASDSNLKKLLLPIYYQEAGIHDSDDEICKIVTALQFEDWRVQKFEDHRSPDYRKLLQKMGNRLVDIAHEVADTPDVEPEQCEPETPPEPPGPGPSSGPNGPTTGDVSEAETSESDGLLDAWVHVEQLVSAVKEQFAEVERALQALMGEISREPPPKNASAGQRLFYINAISLRIQRPAEDFEGAAMVLERTTRELTSTIMLVVDYMADPLWANSAKGLDVESLREAGDRLAAQFAGLKTTRAQVLAIGRMSRKMKEPISIVDRGFDYLEAVADMIGSWLAAFQSLAGEGSPDTAA
jgi:hypothetical protein